MDKCDISESVRLLIGDAELTDVSGRSGDVTLLAKTAEGELFVKLSPRDLSREAENTRFFASRGLAAEVVAYGHDGERDYLVTRRLDGIPLTELCETPDTIVGVLAEALTRLRECGKVAHSCRTLDGDFESLTRGKRPNFEYYSCVTDLAPDDALAYLRENFELIRRDELVHDDLCLPNLLAGEGRLGGLVDLDGAGLGDRHIDIFWAIWSLRYNLRTGIYGEKLLARVAHDPTRLKLCAILSSLDDI